MTAAFQLKGSIVALVTPFLEDNTIDYVAFEKLIELQIAAQTAGIVICGTTGESPSISDEEFEKMLTLAVSKFGSRISIIAGSGLNDTQKTIQRSLIAQKAGVAATLIVNPYYNKPTEQGLYKHFEAIAQAIDLPIILYNVPGRTASNLLPKTAFRLANNFSNIVGIKEASGDLNQINELIINRPDGFLIYSGDDALTLPIMACGGDGVISVVANVIPKPFAEMLRACLENDWKKAQILHQKMYRFMQLSMMESNPIPIKTTLVEQGMIKEVFRLPMCKMSDEELRRELRNVSTHINQSF